MVTTISPARYCLPVQIHKCEAESGLSCSSSLNATSCSLPYQSSKILHAVVGISWPRGRRNSKGGSCRERAVPPKSACKLVDESRPQHETGTGAAMPSAAGAGAATALPTRPEMGLVDSCLESTLEHRLWLGFGATATLGMIAKSVLAAHSLLDDVGIGLGAVAAYVLADLGTGIYHWGIDNYGDAKTPIFGPQIDAFQGHHKRPWTITRREFSNNIQSIARPVGFVLLPFLALPSNPTGDAFLGLFLGLVVMSQQFHSWAHSRNSQVPPAVNFLQENGVLISRKMHGAHHRVPYNINYCIVSGLWNPILNESEFFPRLEAVIYSRWGVAPRCWEDAVAVDWVQEGSYFEDGSEIKVDQEV